MTRKQLFEAAKKLGKNARFELGLDLWAHAILEEYNNYVTEDYNESAEEDDQKTSKQLIAQDSEDCPNQTLNHMREALDRVAGGEPLPRLEEFPRLEE